MAAIGAMSVSKSTLDELTSEFDDDLDIAEDGDAEAIAENEDEDGFTSLEAATDEDDPEEDMEDTSLKTLDDEKEEDEDDEGYF